MDRLLGGRYELGARLGQGATSSVYAARDRRLDRRVAVKVLTTGLTMDGRQRFLREARASARVSHPNVVLVYDAGVDSGLPYLAMELVDGGDLAGVLAARAPLPVVECLEIADRMLAALGALHAAGIVHRDVKPANVLLTRSGEVKLTDFGIARLDDTATLTMEGTVLGTPAYLPPEQAQGERPTLAGDLYSVGAICFEMLTGGPPFGTGPATAVALAHVSAPLPPVRDRRPDAPSAVAAVVERALAKQPADRWAAADAMRVALASAASADPFAATQNLDPLVPTERFGAMEAARAPVRITTEPYGSGRSSPGPEVLAAAATASPAPPAPVDPAPDATATLPSPPPTGPSVAVPTPGPPEPRPSAPPVDGWSARRRWIVAAAVVAALVVAVVAVAANNDDGDGGLFAGASTTTVPPASTGPATTTAPTTPIATTVPTTPAPTTAAPVSAAPGPPTIDSVLVVLGADPSAAGDKGVDLYERLQEVAQLDGQDQGKKARDTLKDIDDWVDDDLLDESIAAMAVAALEPLADRGDGGGDEDD